MKKIFTLLTIIIATVGFANAQLLMYEDFNYSAGALVPSNGSWTNHSGTAGQVLITAGGLSYTSYPTNGSSNKITINSTNTEDISKSFTNQSTAGVKVYASFLIDVSAASTGTYIAHIQNGASNFRGCLWAKTITGGVDFGFSGATTTPTYLGTTYALNTTHLIVISYEIVSGANNDIVKLWVNPDLSGIEPAALATFTLASDLVLIQSFGFREASGAPTCTIDELKVGLAWSNAPLPISLVKFTADKLSEQVKLNWVTATEINNDKFIVERSADGENFELVSEVKGAGNSREINSYNVVDATPLKGTSYYRLTQVDFNGASETFAPVAVNMSGKLHLATVQSNTEAVNIDLNIYSPSATSTSIRVTDLSGRTIASQQVNLVEGYQSVNLNTNNLSSGIHIIQIMNGEEVVMKKLVL